MSRYAGLGRAGGSGEGTLHPCFSPGLLPGLLPLPHPTPPQGTGHGRARVSTLCSHLLSCKLEHVLKVMQASGQTFSRCGRRDGVSVDAATSRRCICWSLEDGNGVSWHQWERTRDGGIAMEQGCLALPGSGVTLSRFLTCPLWASLLCMGL
jgi:hypothetical protein